MLERFYNLLKRSDSKSLASSLSKDASPTSEDGASEDLIRKQRRTLYDFIWTDRHLQYCLDNKIYLGHPRKITGVHKVGNKLRMSEKVVVERHSTMPLAGFCTIGRHSYCASKLPPLTKVGRYSSIAPNVAMMGTQHPIERFTTSPLTYTQRFVDIAEEEHGAPFHLRPFQKYSLPAVIGNDCWIGEGVLLKGGVRIGNGAIVASRSIVTKDVPPYAIVAGSPAQIKRYRFSDEQIERLSATAWWKYRFVDLPSQETWDQIDDFIDALEVQIANGLKPHRSERIRLGKDFKEL